jgi:hypothetical protein
MTPLDHAHALMDKEPEADRHRLRFYQHLADSPLFLLLEQEATEAAISPKILAVDGQDYVLGFDTEARLGDFIQQEAAFATVTGRDLAQMLTGKNIGLGLNLSVAPSAILIPPEALDWLLEVLANPGAEVQDRPISFHAPANLSGDFAGALALRLQACSGMLQTAYLVDVAYETGARGLLLGIVGASAGREDMLQSIAAEAVSFTSEGVVLDVVFLDTGSAIVARLASVGLAIDIPVEDPKEAAANTPAAPGMDPDKPPRLR